MKRQIKLRIVQLRKHFYSSAGSGAKSKYTACKENLQHDRQNRQANAEKKMRAKIDTQTQVTCLGFSDQF